MYLSHWTDRFTPAMECPSRGSHLSPSARAAWKEENLRRYNKQSADIAQWADQEMAGAREKGFRDGYAATVSALADDASVEWRGLPSPQPPLGQSRPLDWRKGWEEGREFAFARYRATKHLAA